MEWSYWKVVMRYGHVGHRREINVARYLVVPSSFTLIDVMRIAEEMPGTKNRAALSINKIELKEYLEGKRLEKEDFFLRRLFEGNQAQ